MKRLRTMLLATYAVIASLAGSGFARAQHNDVLVQQMDGQLVTGSADFDGNQWTLGRRVYSREFDGDFAINNPGFNALGSGSPSLPPGSQALPGTSALSWDFLPMKIDDQTANLFFWNGQETDGMPGLTPDDVTFGPLPGPNYSLTLFDKTSTGFAVDGSDELVPGGVIDDTASDGSLHRHRFFLLANVGSMPIDGIYLISMQLRMTSLDNSDPIFLVFGTLGSSVAALDDAAVPWVEEMVDMLVPGGLPGDYNGNDTIDAADYTVWRDALTASSTSLLNDPTPGTVNENDFLYWRSHFGESLSLGGGSGVSRRGALTAVPEPSTAVLLLSAIAALVFHCHAPQQRRSVSALR